MVVHVRTTDWPEREAFIARLDELMKREGIRHDSALAELAGIAHTTPGNWRLGKTKPSLMTVTVINRVLKGRPNELAKAAGMVSDEAEIVEPDPLPDQLRRLIALYRLVGDEGAREQLVRQLDVVADWFESTVLPGEQRKAG